ncbi:hypothetical protein UACE39S_03935 [Ureibacillus acetophenoni]
MGDIGGWCGTTGTGNVSHEIFGTERLSPMSPCGTTGTGNVSHEILGQKDCPQCP